MYIININGIVQGVGFRPFVYKLAYNNNLKGYVRNSSQGVEIAVTGDEISLNNFLKQLKNNSPEASIIDTMIVTTLPDSNFDSFQILPSLIDSGITHISPDLALCPDCLAEMNSTTDPRHEYSFINCTNCGPRYSIIKSLPYDRPATSMGKFEMCDYCSGEYSDPLNRRFHAQPVACSECGPRLQLLDCHKNPVPGDPLSLTRKLLKQGNIIAIKGIGGFHLACLATDDDPVNTLRNRKQRPHKPFAVMGRKEDLDKIVAVKPEDIQLLQSPAAPILILPSTGKYISQLVAPANPSLGIFLPYAPLHHLLLQDDLRFLVMTSGNFHDHPIAACIDELPPICDYYLTHNREILNRCDDSVIRAAQPHNIMIRRSRGYIPTPLSSDQILSDSFAAGAAMKLTFALAARNSIFLSPYIANNDTLNSLDFYQETYNKFCHWFKIHPKFAACDLQPDFMSTRFAEKLDIPLYRIQHHHAHIVAVMAEHQLDEPVIGIAYDGTGLGDDGIIWGSEIMIADCLSYQNKFHLEPLPLPGGDAAIKKPIRIAYAWLRQNMLDTDLLNNISDFEKNIITRQLASNLNVFSTSSMGRLFDCVSAMLDLVTQISFDAQAAMALEFICPENIMDYPPYEYYFDQQNIKIKPLLKNISHDLHQNIPHHIISARFHRTIIEFTLQAVILLRKESSINNVVLAGGVMQNRIIFSNLISLLKRNNFTVFTPRLFPPNDSSIALGQIIIANNLDK
ncbi:MAG: carbamoyltransferase HypF [Candidatus Stygibacter frigidus]|nr:carbamoyltransferase HypF [Candidatus Stygibacter frigidus]